MPIARLSLTEGEPVQLDPARAPELIGELLVARFAELVFLDPGEYELTPESWEDNNYYHHLTVHDNDTGTYRMTPVHKDSATLDLSRTERKVTPGGRIHKIPEDGPVVVVATPSEDLRSIQVYEVIAHLGR